jgi:integrase
MDEDNPMPRRRSKGEGTIYQTSNGSWIAQITLPNGKKKTKTGRTQKTVKDWLLQQRNAIQQNTWTENTSLTTGELLTRWYEEVAAISLRPKTLESYESLLRNHIHPELGTIKLDAFRPEMLQRFYKQKLASGLSNRTVRYIHAIVHRTLDQAVRWGLVSRNVADFTNPPTPKRRQMKVYTPEQIKRFLATAQEDRLYPLWTLTLGCGLRRGEVLGLHWEDVDLERGVIHIRFAVQQINNIPTLTEVKTTSSRRSIPVPQFALTPLQELHSQVSGTGLVFHTRTGKPISPSNLVRSFKALLHRAELPNIRFHDLRHTTASLLLKANVHPKTVQTILGHSQISVTMDIYSHVMPGLQSEAIGKLDELMLI